MIRSLIEMNVPALFLPLDYISGKRDGHQDERRGRNFIEEDRGRSEGSLYQLTSCFSLFFSSVFFFLDIIDFPCDLKFLTARVDFKLP